MTDGLLKDRLKVAQTELLLANIKTNVIAAIVAATVVLLMLLQEPYEPLLLPWYGLLIFLCLLRLVHVRQCEKVELSAQNVAPTIRILGVLTFLSGSAWGSLGLVYLTADNVTFSLIIIMVYTGLVANASLTMASVLRIYLCFVIPIMIPTAYKFYSLDEPQYSWISLLVMVYMTVSFITTGRIRASLQRSNRLLLENNDLIEKLQSQNSKTEAALENAEQANRAKSKFFAAANHDLRQPLQSISMFTTTLSTYTETKIQKKIVSQIDRSVLSLEGLFNALLDISSLDAGTTKLHKQHFYLKPYMDELSLEFIEWTCEKNLSLSVDVRNDVVHTDPILLGRVIRNLVENAVRYTPEGGLKIMSSRTDDHVVLSISDTGLGIPAQKRERIFEEFVQLNNPGRDRNRGLGLGLSIVQRICELLGMPLGVESVEGQGSTFTVGIGYGKVTDVEDQQAPIMHVPLSLDGMFVLIVDDEAEIRDSMEGLLGVWGCTVMVGSSGPEAVQQLIEYDSCPDAIITDYRLQNNETGAGALSLIRKHCAVEIPAIVVTGDISSDRLQDIDELNLPVLHKPCRSSALFACLQDIYTSIGKTDSKRQ